MDFVITKVNGRDVREHADALRAFETAPEPIVVEVRRTGLPGALVSTAVQTETPNAVVCDQDDDDDDELEFILDDAFDYEVVTLDKSESEGVGVSVCYSSAGEEDELECFVGGVAEGSVAARDGRIRRGDQVLQLNGETLTDQLQATRLFAQADLATTVTLLLSRLPPQALNGELDDCDLVSTSFIVKSGGEEDEEDKQSCESNNKSDRKETSSEEDRERSHLSEERLRVIDRQLYELSKKMAVITLDASLPKVAAPTIAAPLRPFGDSETEHIYETIPEEDSEPIYSLPYEPPKHEIWVDVEPTTHKRDSAGSSDKEKDSSSAYNTGESCRSTQLTLDLKTQTAPPSGQQQDTPYSAISCENCRQCIRLPPLGSPSKKNKQHHQQQQQQQQEVPNTMYTNAANLQRTIWLQQEMFRQALERKKSPSSSKAHTPSSPVYHPPNLSNYQFVSGYGVVQGGAVIGAAHKSSTLKHHSYPSQQQPRKQEEPLMVWKVKRKADGTRYITRRPVRNKILQERANKISEERVGLTTDDDAMSELKLGRYWNKEERKKHVERSRERRKQHEMLAREHDEAKQARTKSFQSASSSARRREQRDLQHQQQPPPPTTRICPPTAVLSSRGGKMAAGILSVTTV